MKLEIVDIPLDHLRPQPDNPNEMGPEEERALRNDIEKRGFVQPLLVRPVDVDSANPAIDHEIVDGEHRWRILGELGAETAPCVVDRDTDEADSLLRTVTMNFLRGTFVPIRLASMLSDLSERMPISEIRARMAYSEPEMDNLLDLAGYLDEDPPIPKPHGGGPPAPEGTEVAFVATHKQARQIQDLLDKETGGDAEKEAAVIARKAREYDE